jgi:hypothetical protein
VIENKQLGSESQRLGQTLSESEDRGQRLLGECEDLKQKQVGCQRLGRGAPRLRLLPACCPAWARVKCRRDGAAGGMPRWPGRHRGLLQNSGPLWAAAGRCCLRSRRPLRRRAGQAAGRQAADGRPRLAGAPQAAAHGVLQPGGESVSDEERAGAAHRPAQGAQQHAAGGALAWRASPPPAAALPAPP